MLCMQNKHVIVIVCNKLLAVIYSSHYICAPKSYSASTKATITDAI